jgi:FAD/FMN-containing dehydrogenase
MERFDGTVHRRGDDGYEDARRAAVWNARKPDRHPAAIVVAGSQEDVVRAVGLARAEGLSIGVRSGGHAWGGNAVRDGGLLLDLSQLKAIEVDPSARVATIEPGVRGNELTPVLAEHGLYFPAGHCPTVGIAGFTLGGGFGFNSRVVGPAAFSLRAVDVVTADGAILHATDDDHADVLWAARGAGPGFFAAVTRLYLDVHPLPGVIAASVQMHPLTAYDELMPWYAEITAAMAPEVNPVLVAVHSPIPGRDDTVLMVTAYAFADDLAQAAELLAPLETAPGLDRAIMHTGPHPSSIDQQYALLDQLYPEGFRYLTDNLWVCPAEPQLWQDAKQLFEILPSARSHIVLAPWVQHQHPNAAFGLQTDMSFHVYAVYEDESEDEAMLGWHADALSRVAPHSVGGGKVNDSNLFVRPMAVLRPESAARLEALRAQYDPDGRFCAYPAALPSARLAPA